MNQEIIRIILESSERCVGSVNNNKKTFDNIVKQLPVIDSAAISALSISLTDLISFKVSPEIYQRYCVRFQIIVRIVQQYCYAIKIII